MSTILLAAIPSPDRGVWMLGPIPIRAYALCIIAGIVVAVMWGERRFVARGGPAGTVTDVAVWAVPFGLVGGRLYHVATDWQQYFGPGRNPVEALYVWQGGLGIWGAVALGAVGAWIGCRRRGIPLPFFADAVAPGIVVAQGIGRLGNWFNQELYGGPTTLPWGLEIYRRVDPDTGAPDPIGGVALDPTPLATVHPTFLYELLWNFGVAALVVWADRRFRLGHGRAFALYVAGYTAGRFWIELMRTDQATLVFGGIRINVVTSVVVFVGAVLYFVLAERGREELVPGPAAADGDPVDAEVVGEKVVGGKVVEGETATGRATDGETVDGKAADGDGDPADGSAGGGATAGPDADPAPARPAAGGGATAAATPDDPADPADPADHPADPAVDSGDDPADRADDPADEPGARGPVPVGKARRSRSGSTRR